MINITKSQPAPSCLKEEEKKANGDYKCGQVLSRLRKDFNDKCYICESTDLTNINIEHFKPHKGDKILKFDWNNLFYACGHCNNTKLAKYDDILNCTASKVKITDLISFKINPFPHEQAKIEAVISNKTDIKIINTVELLDAVYRGTTPMKKIQASHIRQNLVVEIATFQKLLIKYYFTKGLSEEDKTDIGKEIKRKLHPASPFTAFKIWIIKRNATFRVDFGKFLP